MFRNWGVAFFNTVTFGIVGTQFLRVCHRLNLGLILDLQNCKGLGTHNP